MADQRRDALARPRRARSAVLLLLVALTALAGWTVAPTGATAARAGSTVAGAVAKQAGPVVTRTTRGPFAGVLARAGHQVTHVQRAATEELPGSHGGLLVVLTALVALVLTGRRVGLARSGTAPPADRPRELRRGRAPPTGVPTPA